MTLFFIMLCYCSIFVLFPRNNVCKIRPSSLQQQKRRKLIKPKKMKWKFRNNRGFQCIYLYGLWCCCFCHFGKLPLLKHRWELCKQNSKYWRVDEPNVNFIFIEYMLHNRHLTETSDLYTFINCISLAVPVRILHPVDISHISLSQTHFPWHLFPYVG